MSEFCHFSSLGSTKFTFLSNFCFAFPAAQDAQFKALMSVSFQPSAFNISFIMHLLMCPSFSRACINAILTSFLFPQLVVATPTTSSCICLIHIPYNTPKIYMLNFIWLFPSELVNTKASLFPQFHPCSVIWI